MTSAMTETVGLTLPQRGVFFGVTTVPEMLALAARVDSDPRFGSVWVGDSLGAKPRPDSIALLGALAGVTRRVRLGVGCMASFPVRDPVVLAYQWATLDLVANGRMLLAACNGLVGGGLSAREGAAFGVSDRERPSRLVENIEICRRLWSEERVSYKGRFRSFDDLTLVPRPVQQPCPIWIASNPRPPLAGAALEETKTFLDAYYSSKFSPAFVEGWTIAGPPSRCIEELRAYFDAGLGHMALRLGSWNQHGQLRRFLEEVAPALTAR